jgi:hypothetical protein
VRQDEIGDAPAHSGESYRALGDRLDFEVWYQEHLYTLASIGVAIGPYYTRPPRIPGRGRDRTLNPGGVVDGTDRLPKPAQRFFDKYFAWDCSRGKYTCCVDTVCGEVSDAKRYPDDELAAAVWFTLHPDHSAVKLRELLYQSEADAHAFPCPPAQAVSPRQMLEQPGECFYRNAHTGVPHLELSKVSASTQYDFDRALKRELECVRKKVEDEFLPQVAVDVNRLAEIVPGLEAKPGALDHWAENGHEISSEPR